MAKAAGTRAGGGKESKRPGKTTKKTSTAPSAKKPSPEVEALAAKRAADKATREKLMNDLKATTSQTAQGARAPGAAQAGLGADKVGLLGNAVWLLTQTQTHKHLFIGDLEWLIMPPLALDQFRLWRQGNMPVAFATWAFMSDEAEERMMQGVRRISPMDWKSGDNLWLMDMIAPFGGEEGALKELREKIFPGKRFKTLQPAPSGEGMAVVEW